MLPDGITHMKGFVKDPNEGKRYLALDDDGALSAAGKDYVELQDGSDNPQDRRNTDLTKTVCVALL